MDETSSPKRLQEASGGDTAIVPPVVRSASASVSVVLALVIGIAGALVFAHFQLPLPWMLGAMGASSVAALARLPVTMPSLVRQPMLAIIGVMLGARLQPELFKDVWAWLPTLALIVVFVATSGFLCMVYFQRVAGLDPRTAYFSAMPGGLMEMIILGERSGGNVQVIALCQSARILLLVFTLPFLIRYLGDASSLTIQTGAAPSIFDADWQSHLWLLVTAAAGALFGRIARLPAGWLFGPFLVSGLVHLASWSNFQPSVEIVNAAQLIIGTVLGCSFARSNPALVLRMLKLSAGATVILLATTFTFAFLASQVSSYGFLPLLLAYSPGGLAEMSLMALVLQVETGFVVLHHIARITLVLFGARLVFSLVFKDGKAATSSLSKDARKDS
ncbi:AbrB family transcriptional regulator [Chelativorans sp. Marseille-P2723]|uniref:AbrB family transcriptional regulator n=1 Tax=Chelativorans sp. Marseille-P2723 TaxID=2709133 RepID=UPI001570A88B|nr:AbrB family transcriptional regulator [Chelativorans sp. Marseille-P2723]